MIPFTVAECVSEAKQLFLSPRSFFQSMPMQVGWKASLAKAAVYSVLAGVIGAVYALLFLKGLSAVAGILGALLLSSIVGIIAFFIASMVLMLISMITGGTTSFEAAMRVTAVNFVLVPCGVLLMLPFMVIPLVALAVKLAVSLFGLWLMFNGLVYALGAKARQAKIAVGVLGLLAVVITSRRR
jgi:hypothetical protein